MVAVLAALFLVPLFLAGGVAVVVVGLLAGGVVLAVVVCRRPRHRGPMIVLPVVVCWIPQEVPMPAEPKWWRQPQPQPQIEDCPTGTPADWEAWSAEIARRCGTE